MNQIDSATFWRHPSFVDLCLFKAWFRRHRYELHTHPTYVIALITHGCERLRIGKRQEIAAKRSVIIVHPEECHDGEPGIDDGWAYRTLYPSVPFMTDVARELGHDGPPVFSSRIIADPALADGIADAHKLAEGEDSDAAEASMLLALRQLIVRHADKGRRPETIEQSGARQRFVAYLGAMNDRCELQHLANVAGVTRFQVIRDFKRMTGLTPGAYLRNRRLRHASAMLEQGAAIADAASAAGFADQSHLSRAFRSTHGITPAMFRRASGHTLGWTA